MIKIFSFSEQPSIERSEGCQLTAHTVKKPVGSHDRPKHWIINNRNSSVSIHHGPDMIYFVSLIYLLCFQELSAPWQHFHDSVQIWSQVSDVAGLHVFSPTIHWHLINDSDPSIDLQSDTYAITRSCKKTLSPWQSDGIQPHMKARRSCWNLLKKNAMY